MSTVTTHVTTEQLLAMPDSDKVERELIRGELREKPMTRRNRFHTFAVARVTQLLGTTVDGLPAPRGEVHSGEVGVILRRDPDSTVGIDVAYFSSETIARQTDETTLIEGVPELAVEVLSPSDKHEEIRDKVREYIAVGVKEVWVVDPDFQTVQVHQPSLAPVSYNREQEMTCHVLESLRFAVAEIFPQQ